MNTNTQTGAAALLAAMILAGAATAWGAVGTDYLSDASLMLKVTGGTETSSGYGAVGYDYYIGTYEVTNAQYAKFLNTIGVTTSSNSLGLYNPSQSSYGLTWNAGDNLFVGDNRPVVCVSFYDAVRFVNWLTNGGTASSDTESGMYTLTVEGGSTQAGARNADAWNAGGFAIANENEWHRAAYYDPTKGGTGGFWNYATQSNDYSGGLTASNGQNYLNSGNGNKALDVGSFINATSYFGTYDQGGNVREWTENGTMNRILRGASFSTNANSLKAGSDRYSSAATIKQNNFGFRIVSLTLVPESGMVPGAMGLAALAVGVWVRRQGSCCSRGRAARAALPLGPSSHLTPTNAAGTAADTK